MNKKMWFLLLLSIIAGFSLSAIFLLALKPPTEAAAAQPADVLAPAVSSYRLLAWNDLGMHCYNRDFTDMAVLPPYNNLWAQVVLVGNPPQLVTTGIQVTYVFTDNTYSVGKSNFWTYAQHLFSLKNPLPDNVGLKGKGLSGTMDLAGDHFVAEGIPLTEFSDSAPAVAQPYQLALITVKDSSSQAILAEARVVAPVSTEMHCDYCHGDTGIATVSGGITGTGKVETNILALHDKLELAKYPSSSPAKLMDSRPVLCAKCHASNALGAPGVMGIMNLSKAMHTRHTGVSGITPDTSGCYNCHPGPVTQCLRDVMSQEAGMTCISCHGDITHVATNPNPWLYEPRCDTCHSDSVYQNQALYRHSLGHSGIYCEGCHDSTHAIATSREPRDAIKFIALQGHAGTLSDCLVCHSTQPTGNFQHYVPLQIYLPVVHR